LDKLVQEKEESKRRELERKRLECEEMSLQKQQYDQVEIN